MVVSVSNVNKGAQLNFEQKPVALVKADVVDISTKNSAQKPEPTIGQIFLGEYDANSKLFVEKADNFIGYSKKLGSLSGFTVGGVIGALGGTAIAVTAVLLSNSVGVGVLKEVVNGNYGALDVVKAEAMPLIASVSAALGGLFTVGTGGMLQADKLVTLASKLIGKAYGAVVAGGKVARKLIGGEVELTKKPEERPPFNFNRPDGFLSDAAKGIMGIVGVTTGIAGGSLVGMAAAPFIHANPMALSALSGVLFGYMGLCGAQAMVDGVKNITV